MATTSIKPTCVIISEFEEPPEHKLDRLILKLGDFIGFELEEWRPDLLTDDQEFHEVVWAVDAHGSRRPVYQGPNNIIRWRYQRDAQGEIQHDAQGQPIIQSNSRLNVWNNHRTTLQIGSEVYMVDEFPDNFHLFKESRPSNYLYKTDKINHMYHVRLAGFQAKMFQNLVQATTSDLRRTTCSVSLEQCAKDFQEHKDLLALDAQGTSGDNVLNIEDLEGRTTQDVTMDFPEEPQVEEEKSNHSAEMDLPVEFLGDEPDSDVEGLFDDL